MLYDLSLHIGSNYAHPVATGRHVLRIAPLPIPGRQDVERQAITIDPEPDSRHLFRGFFGGEATGFAIRHPHQKLEATLSARVHVTVAPWKGDQALAMSAMPTALAGIASVAPLAPHHFLHESPRLPKAGAALGGYARDSLTPGANAFEIAQDLMLRINGDFKYDSKATNVDTPAETAFHMRRGVCQDFTHVMIMALRALGIPAGYVSGYLRTLPPEGKAKLVGADAMHAWVMAWCGPESGWIEFDPTNRMLASEDHIVVGHGRDYADIAPLTGTVKGHGHQSTFQRVDINVVE